MESTSNAPLYIVAGDEMQKIMRRMFPERESVPFREDLSKGPVKGNQITGEFISERAAFWGVSPEEYERNLDGIINLELAREVVLCFGEDDCCKANCAFMLAYLKQKGYKKPIRVKVVNEITLEILREYTVLEE